MEAIANVDILSSREIDKRDYLNLFLVCIGPVQYSGLMQIK